MKHVRCTAEAALQTPHLLDGQWIDVKRAQPAENLPPPKFTYPRTRQEMEADAESAGEAALRRRMNYSFFKMNTSNLEISR